MPQELIDKKLVKLHFDLHVEKYDAFTPVQSTMANNLLHLIREKLPHDSAPDRVLEVGCGTGRLTRLLAQIYPRAHIDAVDIAPRAIDYARQRKGENSSLRYIVADAEDLAGKLPAPVPYNLIISNATVQWFNTPILTIRDMVKKYLAPRGILSLSTFGPKTFIELRESLRCAETRLQLAPVSRVHQFTAPSEWVALARESDQEKGETTFREELQLMRYPSFRDFLKTIRHTGATNAYQRKAVILGKSLLHEWEQQYHEHYSDSQTGEIFATYHHCYIVIIKK